MISSNAFSEGVPWGAMSLALGPVMAFLLVLILLDTFRLVPWQRIFGVLLAGAAVGAVGYIVSSSLIRLTGMPYLTFAYNLAPLVEESLKAAVVLWILRTGRAGFLVDSAILGFAVGAGFSVLENLYYLALFGEAPLAVWLIRGFGTAIMHGGCTALFAVAARGRLRDPASGLLRAGWPGLVIAVIVHAGFNRAMGWPVPTTAVLLVILPLLLRWIYRLSEGRLRDWVGRGFDRDQELLSLIREGRIGGTPLGRYLGSLRDTFPPETVTDMFCLLRIRAELSIAAKGALLRREHGFAADDDPARMRGTAERLQELRWLENSIGKAGLLALQPLTPCRERAAWQRQFLEDRVRLRGIAPDPRGADPS